MSVVRALLGHLANANDVKFAVSNIGNVSSAMLKLEITNANNKYRFCDQISFFIHEHEHRLPIVYNYMRNEAFLLHCIYYYILNYLIGGNVGEGGCRGPN